MKRTTTILLVVLAVIGCKGRDKKADQYKTEKTDRGNVTMTVTATGTLSAVTTVQIGSQVSGVIARLFADHNSQVKKGQLLAELDPTPFQAQVEQRRADVTRATVEMQNAKITYDRQRRLAQAGLAPEADLDSARAQFEGARAQVAQSSAALRQAETNFRYTKITSPTDGVVVDKQYEVGQTVAASFQAPVLFEIAQDLTKMQVQADVDQSDIGRVHVGQMARFNVDAYPEDEFRGRIAQIRYNAQVNQNVVTYPVIIEVDNPEGRLRPKMTANVTIDVATVRDVLRVPNTALRFKPPAEEGKEGATSTSGGGGGESAERRAMRSGQGGPGPAGAASQMPAGRRRRAGAGDAAAEKQQTVYVLGADKKLKPVQIRTGISDGRFTAVVSGDLKVGDPVVIGVATAKVEGPPPMGGGGQPGGPRGGGGRR